MADDEQDQAEQRPLTADRVAQQSFPTAFRGFDPVEVRAFLTQVADELRSAEARIAELEGALATPGQASQAPPGGEPEEIAEAARQAAEAARAEALASATAEAEMVLRDARTRAEALEAEARGEADRIRSAAEADASRLRSEAEEEVASRREAVSREHRSVAEREANKVRAEAEQAAAARRVAAEEEATKRLKAADEEAAAVIEAARERGREMVTEAQAARERMLTDLARRKRAAQVQLEQLRAGRDRLLDSLRSARRGLDELTLRFEAAEMAAGGRAAEPLPRPSDARAERPADRPAERSERAERSDRPVGRGERAASEEAAAPAAARPGPEPAAAIRPTARPVIDAPRAEAAAAPPEEQRVAAEPAGEEPQDQNGTNGTGRGERRSSALRILRRHRPGAELEGPSPVEPRPGFRRVEGPDADSDAVRILGPSRAADEKPSERLAEPAGDAVGSAVAGDEAAVAAPPGSEPEAEPEAEPEPAPWSADVATAASDAAPDAAPEAEPDAAPEAEPELEPEPAPASVAKPQPAARSVTDVDDLFARIRADRAATTAQAREVLEVPPTDTPAEPPAAAEQPTARQADAGEPPAAVPEPVRVAGHAEHATPAISPVMADEAALEARDRALDPLEAQLVRRLKRAVQDEQNEALDRLRTHRGKVVAAAVLSAEADQQSHYAGLAVPFLEQAAAAASASPYGATPVAADDLAVQLATEIADGIRARLTATLDHAADPLDLAASTERIGAVYREWKSQKVEPLAVHYLVAAHARGAFVTTPEGTPLRWVVDDAGPCPDCDDNALAGPTPRGVAFPTGHLLPPAHVGCRCLLVVGSSS